MSTFTITRAMICAATDWRYHRVRAIIETPYRLQCQFGSSGPQGGGRTERFRLGDVLARCRDKRAFDELTMSSKLFAADAGYRKDNKQ